MTKQRVILRSALFCLMGLFVVQALPQPRNTRASGAKRQRRMTDVAMKKPAAERRAQRESKAKELAEQGRGMAFREQLGKQAREETEVRKRGFLMEKETLGVTEEQWKPIKAKLEEVRRLKERANSMAGASLASGSSDGRTGANAPTWQLKVAWKDTPAGELTEAQRLAAQLVALLRRPNTTPQTLKRKMAELRRARREEAEIDKQLAEARRQLCEMLTTRQEAALVLMHLWL